MLHSPISPHSIPQKLPFWVGLAVWFLPLSAHWRRLLWFWGGLDQIKLSRPGPCGRVAPSHHLICVSHCHSSPPFLFSPLLFVCLMLLLSIWPTIDKTQSLTMLGKLHRISGDGAHALWWACVCSGFWKEMGMWLMSLFIYLSTSRWRSAERMCFLTHSFSTSPFPHSFPSSTSPVAQSGVWAWFQVQNFTTWGEGEGGERANKAACDLRGSPAKSGGRLRM